MAKKLSKNKPALFLTKDILSPAVRIYCEVKMKAFNQDDVLAVFPMKTAWELDEFYNQALREG